MHAEVVHRDLRLNVQTLFYIFLGKLFHRLISAEQNQDVVFGDFKICLRDENKSIVLLVLDGNDLEAELVDEIQFSQRFVEKTLGRHQFKDAVVPDGGEVFQHVRILYVSGQADGQIFLRKENFVCSHAA